MDVIWANLFEAERPLSIGTGENLIWIDGAQVGVRFITKESKKKAKPAKLQ